MKQAKNIQAKRPEFGTQTTDHATQIAPGAPIGLIVCSFQQLGKGHGLIGVTKQWEKDAIFSGTTGQRYPINDDKVAGIIAVDLMTWDGLDYGQMALFVTR